jgi:ankyrin repeat protein
MVGRLLQAGANPNLALLACETSLMVASRSGSEEVVAQLLAKGANVNAHGPRRQTALMWAVAQRHPDVVKRLFELGKSDAAGGFPDYLLQQAESAEDAPGCSPFAAIR